MVDDANRKSALDMTDAEAREGLRRLEREDYAQQESRFRIPDDLAGRSALTMSRDELDRVQQGLGLDRQHWSRTAADQRAWSADPANVARREEDVRRVEAERAASEGGGGS